MDDITARNNAEKWLMPPFTKKTREHVERLLRKDKEAINSFFSTKLSFGTGGLRALMGLGEACVNIYTVAWVSAGLCSYLRKTQNKQDAEVLIGFDGRKNSALFAQAAALTFVHYDFKVLLFGHAVPTPLVSYWGRHSAAQLSVVITASHNPAEYNGYKVYSSDGAQVASPLDAEMMDCVEKEQGYPKIDFEALENVEIISSKENSLENWNDNLVFSALKNEIKLKKVAIVGDEIKTNYLSALHNSLCAYSALYEAKEPKLKVHYTALHGVGAGLTALAFKKLSFAELHLFSRQCVVDENFETVAMPNPEEDSALKLPLEHFKKKGGDLLLAADADADRIRAACPLHLGELEAVPFSGNEMAVLLADFAMQVFSKEKLADSFIIKTVVTSSLLEKIARQFGVGVLSTLPGFKNISALASKNSIWKRLLLGLEDSCGYNVGDFVRDKDGVQAAVLITIACNYWKARGLTLHERLDTLFITYGYHLESIVSLHKNKPQEIFLMMEKFRKNPLSNWGGAKLVDFHDLQKSEKLDEDVSIKDLHARASYSVVEQMQTLPGTNAVWLRFYDGTTLLVRPSGTEPKIKFYIQLVSVVPKTEMIKGSMEKKSSKWLREVKKECQLKKIALEAELMQWLQE